MPIDYQKKSGQEEELRFTDQGPKLNTSIRIHRMRKCALLYNPLSGRRWKRRVADVEAVARVLRGAGVEVSTAASRSFEEAITEARRAIESGCDTVFACGGDGTIHAVIQELAATTIQLAVIPFGTANALAHDLRLPINSLKAAQAALYAQPQRIALGRIEYLNFNRIIACRYFTVAAGVGVDAHLFYALTAGLKEKLGMTAYYLKAWHLWWTYHMQRFQVEFNDQETGEQRALDPTQLLAVRIRNFGGLLRELAAGADLSRNDLRVVLCKTENRFIYLSYVFRGLIGGKWQIPEVELAYTRSLSCEANSGRIYVEADGELLGTPPVRISIVPDALTILVPR